MAPGLHTDKAMDTAMNTAVDTDFAPHETPSPVP